MTTPHSCQRCLNTLRWRNAVAHDQVWEQFQAFKARSDTFSLGVCNGCQLMALLGWIPKVCGLQARCGVSGQGATSLASLCLCGARLLVFFSLASARFVVDSRALSPNFCGGIFSLACVLSFFPVGVTAAV